MRHLQTYTLVSSDAELRKLASEMIAAAEANPIDPRQIDGMIDADPGTKEQVGPMVRITGRHSEFTQKCTRYITLHPVDVKALQITVYVYKTDEGSVRQLTIVENRHESLLPQDVSRIASFFFRGPTQRPDTPSHVAVLLGVD